MNAACLRNYTGPTTALRRELPGVLAYNRRLQWVSTWSNWLPAPSSDETNL